MVRLLGGHGADIQKRDRVRQLFLKMSVLMASRLSSMSFTNKCHFADPREQSFGSGQRGVREAALPADAAGHGR